MVSFVPVNFSEIKNRTHMKLLNLFSYLLPNLSEKEKQHKTEGSSFAAEDSFDAISSIFKESAETNG